MTGPRRKDRLELPWLRLLFVLVLLSSPAMAQELTSPRGSRPSPSQATFSDLQIDSDGTEETETNTNTNTNTKTKTPPSGRSEQESEPPPEPIRRPEPLPRYTPRRSSSLQEERHLDMSGPKLQVIEFNDIPLQEATRIISEQVGLKIVPTSKAADVQVSLYLRDVPPMVAVDALTKAHGLFWRRDSETEIIRIFTVEEYEADLAGFREEETEVFTLLYPNPLDIALAIRDLYGDRVVLNMGMFTDMLVVQDLMQRFMRFNMVEMQNNMGGGFGGGIGGGFGGGMGGMGMGGMGMGGMGMGGMGMGGMGMGGMGMGGMGGMGMGGMGGMGMAAWVWAAWAWAAWAWVGSAWGAWGCRLPSNHSPNLGPRSKVCKPIRFKRWNGRDKTRIVQRAKRRLTNC
jgi:hypothetical protein